MAYVNPNQLTLPEEFANVDRFPDRGVSVDGFIVCVDLSAPFGPTDLQRDFFTKLISSVQGSKKPVVIACTKMDMAVPENLTVVKEVVDKLKKVPQLVEVSAHEGVNIDLCFLVLAHLVDSKKPRSRIVPYEEAKGIVDARVKKNETSFKGLLDWKLTDFAMAKETAFELVKKEIEWQSVAQLKGTERCKKLVRLRLSELWVAAIENKRKIFHEHLPGYISSLLTEVTLVDTVDTCLARVIEHKQFSEHFVNTENWEENKEFLLSSSSHVPISVLKSEVGLRCVQEHMHQLQTIIREERAKEKIKNVLENSSSLLPGMCVCLSVHVRHSISFQHV